MVSPIIEISLERKETIPNRYEFVMPDFHIYFLINAYIARTIFISIDLLKNHGWWTKKRNMGKNGRNMDDKCCWGKMTSEGITEINSEQDGNKMENNKETG